MLSDTLVRSIRQGYSSILTSVCLELLRTVGWLKVTYTQTVNNFNALMQIIWKSVYWFRDTDDQQGEQIQQRLYATGYCRYTRKKDQQLPLNVRFMCRCALHNHLLLWHWIDIQRHYRNRHEFCHKKNFHHFGHFQEENRPKLHQDCQQ